MALIPKGALSSKRAATVAVIISFVGLLVIPVITMPAMLVAGFGWRSAPRWTRLSLVIGPVIFAIYVLANQAARPGRPALARAPAALCTGLRLSRRLARPGMRDTVKLLE